MLSSVRGMLLWLWNLPHLSLEPDVGWGADGKRPSTRDSPSNVLSPLTSQVVLIWCTANVNGPTRLYKVSAMVHEDFSVQLPMVSDWPVVIAVVYQLLPLFFTGCLLLCMFEEDQVPYTRKLILCYEYKHLTAVKKNVDLSIPKLTYKSCPVR